MMETIVFLADKMIVMILATMIFIVFVMAYRYIIGEWRGWL